MLNGKLLVLNRWCFIPFGQTWTKEYNYIRWTNEKRFPANIFPHAEPIYPFYIEVHAMFWWNHFPIWNGYLSALNGDCSYGYDAEVAQTQIHQIGLSTPKSKNPPQTTLSLQPTKIWGSLKSWWVTSLIFRLEASKRGWQPKFEVDTSQVFWLVLFEKGCQPRFVVGLVLTTFSKPATKLGGWPA